MDRGKVEIIGLTGKRILPFLHFFKRNEMFLRTQKSRKFSVKKRIYFTTWESKNRSNLESF
ncbi:hypothetical protein DLM75_11895 [Leptospira stimsonii]|uniref:Uncharacterized protein n=1 Tax=Leptospira stimsonii TaxID=2202203 RepID=A0A396Z4K5_9LEPT|nr:hypothetical protein DLM75_11895 [Leptospira stimsonii]